MMRLRTRALLVAFIALMLFLLLGHSVDHRPDPDWLLEIEATWVNHSTLLAWWLTWCGYAYVLIPCALVLIGVAVARPSWRWPAALAIVALLVAWQGADVFQHVFARPRRLDWVVKHETAFSYPSSHAAIATAFYGLLGVLVWRRGGRAAGIGGSLLVLVALGIIWSRLSLAAHYLTDLLGGLLWGVVVVATLSACLPTNVFEGRSSASLE